MQGKVLRLLALVPALCWIVGACSSLQPATVVPTETVAPAAAPPTSTPLPAVPDVYAVQLWLSNPQPLLGERIILFASLLQNGQPMSGEQMKATWPDRNAPGGTAVCWDKPNYARGICYITVNEQYAPGEPVPITVQLSWLGQWYSGQISFTPH